MSYLTIMVYSLWPSIIDDVHRRATISAKNIKMYVEFDSFGQDECHERHRSYVIVADHQWSSTGVVYRIR